MSDLSPTARAKRKQLFFMGAILVGILALSAIGVYFSSDIGSSSTVTRQKDLKTKSYIAPGEKIEPQDAWRGAADTRLNILENKLTKVQTENNELKKKLDEKGDKSSSTSSPEKMSDDDLDKRLKEYEKTVERTTPYPQGTPSKPQPGQVTPAGAQQKPQQAQGPGKPPGQTADGKQMSTQIPSNGMLTVRLHNPDSSLPSKLNTGSQNGDSGQKNTGATDSKEKPKTTQNYLPSGMFGQAIVLSGLDAPTGGQAQSNPHPVLLQLRDLAILPNRYRYDWKSCTVTGAGYGDISSERAYIRTESLSCVSKDGRVLDVPLKGYIAGEDGKAGMRGRLISKQGQALANGLLAGVVSGIGSGLEKSSTIVSTSPLGSTSTPKPGSEYQAGIGQGVARSLDRLSNYYIQLAEKMFPIIEVDAGRVVDVVLTKGVYVDVDLQQE
jgi:conjugal transfer pilus assembly protein TraB